MCLRRNRTAFYLAIDSYPAFDTDIWKKPDPIRSRRQVL